MFMFWRIRGYLIYLSLFKLRYTKHNRNFSGNGQKIYLHVIGNKGIK